MRLPIPPPRQRGAILAEKKNNLAKRRPTRTALRRRSRAERADEGADNYRREIVRELERAGAPLEPRELMERLEIRTRERRAFNDALEALERAGEIVENRAGVLLVARKIALIAGRVEGHPDGHGFLIPDERGASVQEQHPTSPS